MSNYFMPVDFDKDNIKESLKQFLRTKDAFKDFDFDGSAIATVVDILVQNDMYLAYLASMLTNEAAYDTAQIRSMVVSHARRMSYTPRSVSAASAEVDVKVTPGNLATAPALVTIPRNTKFTASIDDRSYYFVTTESSTVTLNSNTGTYNFSGVNLVQGKFYTKKVTIAEEGETIEIPTESVDTNHIKVVVQNSETDTFTVLFQKADSILNINENSSIYFVEENYKGTYTISFGDGIIGSSISPGNVVTVEYLVTDGPAANKIDGFVPVNAIDGYSNIEVTKIAEAKGGLERESIERIKYTAPKARRSKKRAVVLEDYEEIVLRTVPQAKSVASWGGEDNDPPSYGDVFISINPIDGFTFSDTEKRNIEQEIRRSCIGPIHPIVVDPDYINLEVEADVFYQRELLKDSANDLSDRVYDAILNFDSNLLGSYENKLRVSSLTTAIDKTDRSILSSAVSIKMRKVLEPEIATTPVYELKFNNKIKPGSVYMSGFRVIDPISTGLVHIIEDDGEGSINLYSTYNNNKVLLESGVGTVNYDTGKVTINKVQMTQATGPELDIYAEPANSIVEAVRNNILKMDPAKINVQVVAE